MKILVYRKKNCNHVATPMELNEYIDEPIFSNVTLRSSGELAWDPFETLSIY
jgi:hypothetical protein